MTDQQLYCDGPGRDPGDECGLPVAGHGRGKCPSHLKQLQRVGKCTPIAEKLNPVEKLLEAANRLADADSDEDFEAAKRSAITAGLDLGDKERRQAIRDAMAAARSRGVRLGRPAKVSMGKIRELIKLLKRPSLVASVLGTHRATIYRYLARSRKTPHVAKRPIPRQVPSGAGRPRERGGSRNG